MDVGGSSNATATKTWTVITTQLKLAWTLDESTINSTINTLNLDWSFTGAQGIEKTTTIIIDDVYTVTSKSSSISLNPIEYNLNHGAHKFEMYASAIINGTKIDTPSIFKRLIFAEENNSAPIIAISFFENEIQQYNSVEIPFRIYVSTNVAGTETVTFLENSEVRGNASNCANGVLYKWVYTPKAAGI
jgi:hypothetical protein